MKDTIYRQDALDALRKMYEERKLEYDRWFIQDYKKMIEALPSAQTEIIACGDCKYWICHDRRCGYWNHGVKPLDWCCHAERRSDE